VAREVRREVIFFWWKDAESGGGKASKTSVLLGFLRQNVPDFEQNRKKQEKTCGNQRNGIDKALGKAECELR
jgi:hypothetical protein